MFRTRLVLLSLLATLSGFAVLASSASAKISFEWLVGSKRPLAAGETREFTATNGGKLSILKGTVGASSTELTSSTLKVEKGAKIIGGKPGTNEETVVFEGVKVVKPLNEGEEACAAHSPGAAAGTIKTTELATQIVENQTNGEPLILFLPKTGTNFVTIEFANKGGTVNECQIKGEKPSVAGSVLALPLPELGDVLTADLDFEAVSKEFLLNPGGGTVEKAGLILGSKPATFTALALVTLVSDELFGIF
jgi:hypothetical protein